MAKTAGDNPPERRSLREIADATSDPRVAAAEAKKEGYGTRAQIACKILCQELHTEGDRSMGTNKSRASGRINVNLELVMALVFAITTIFIGPAGCRNWNSWWEEHNQPGDIDFFGHNTFGRTDWERDRAREAAEADRRAREIANAAYVAPNGSFDHIVGWTVEGSTFRRVYATSRLVAPSGVSGKWVEEVKNITASPTTTTQNDVSGTVTIDGIACVSFASTTPTAELETRVVFKDADGVERAVADFFGSAYYKRDTKTVGFTASTAMRTLSIPGTTRPAGWFGRNGSFNLRVDSVNGSLNQHVFYWFTSRLSRLDGLHLRGPSTGTLTANLTPLDKTARTRAEIERDPSLVGIVDGTVLRRIEGGLTPGDYSMIPVNLPEIGTSRLDTSGDPFEVPDPDNANVKAQGFRLEGGHVRQKGTTITKFFVRPAGSILTLEDDKAGVEFFVLALLSNGEFVDVTMDIPATAFSYNASTVEVKAIGSNPLDHPEVKDRLVLIPKAKGTSNLEFTPPQTLGATLPVQAGTVTVKPKLERITIEPSTITIEREASQQFKVKKYYTDKTSEFSLEDVVLTLSDPLVGTLNKQTGDFNAGTTLGSFTLVATPRGAKEVTATITVDKNIATLALSPENVTAKVGETVKFTTVVTDTDGLAVNASGRVTLKVTEPDGSATTKAEVLSSEEVKITAAGTFKVMATAMTKTGEKESNKATVVGVSTLNVGQLNLGGPSEMLVGQTASFPVTDGSGNDLTSRFPARSSNGNVLAMGASNRAEAKTVGTATVSIPGTQLSKTVTVKPGVDTTKPITLTPASISGKKGDTGRLQVVIPFSDGTTGTDPRIGTFTVSEEKNLSGATTTGIITVNPDGAFTLAEYGTAKVTYSVSGASAVVLVSVQPTTTAITPATTSVSNFKNTDAAILIPVTSGKSNSTTDPLATGVVVKAAPDYLIVTIDRTTDPAKAQVKLEPRPNRSGSGGSVILTHPDGVDSAPITVTLDAVLAKVVKPTKKTILVGATGQVDPLKGELNNTANAGGPSLVDVPFTDVTFGTSSSSAILTGISATGGITAGNTAGDANAPITHKTAGVTGTEQDVTVTTLIIGSLMVGQGASNPTVDATVAINNATPAVLLALRLTAGAVEDVKVTGVTIAKAGTALAADIGGVELFRSGGNVLATLSSWDTNGNAVFTLAVGQLTIAQGTSVDLLVRIPATKVTTGAGRTLSAQVTLAGITATGGTYNQSITPTFTGGWAGAATPQTIVDLSQQVTSLTVRMDTGGTTILTGSPSLRTFDAIAGYASGTTSNVVGSLSSPPFSSSSTEILAISGIGGTPGLRAGSVTVTTSAFQGLTGSLVLTSQLGSTGDSELTGPARAGFERPSTVFSWIHTYIAQGAMPGAKDKMKIHFYNPATREVTVLPLNKVVIGTNGASWWMATKDVPNTGPTTLVVQVFNGDDLASATDYLNRNNSRFYSSGSTGDGMVFTIDPNAGTVVPGQMP